MEDRSDLDSNPNCFLQVTMVGGHVIEFGIGTQRIVALHTIP